MYTGILAIAKRGDAYMVPLEYGTQPQFEAVCLRSLDTAPAVNIGVGISEQNAGLSEITVRYWVPGRQNMAQLEREIPARAGYRKNAIHNIVDFICIHG